MHIVYVHMYVCISASDKINGEMFEKKEETSTSPDVSSIALIPGKALERERLKKRKIVQSID